MITMPNQMKRKIEAEPRSGSANTSKRRHRSNRHGRQEDAQVFDALRVVRKVLCQGQDDDQLADLGRLYSGTGYINPAPGAELGLANEQDEDQCRQQSEIQADGPLRQKPIVEPRNDETGAYSNHGKRELPPDRAAQDCRDIAASVCQRAAVDKQKPVDSQAQCCEEQDEVERALISPGDHGESTWATFR